MIGRGSGFGVENGCLVWYGNNLNMLGDMRCVNDWS